jgi:hypothetical protein
VQGLPIVPQLSVFGPFVGHLGARWSKDSVFIESCKIKQSTFARLSLTFVGIMPAKDQGIRSHFYVTSRKFSKSQTNTAVYCRSCVDHSVALIQQRESASCTDTVAAWALPAMRSEDDIRKEGESLGFIDAGATLTTRSSCE